jgi:hypothetical protein
VRRGSIANAALVALLFVVGVGLALAFERKPADSETSSDTSSDTVTPDANAPLVTTTVSNAAGQSVALVTPGEPAIIMISSVTCSWCKRALGDLRELSGGRPLTRLKLLTLEGAAEGGPMVGRESLNGVQLIGPVSGASKVTLTFRFQGTPTFIAVDRNGRVVQTMPGYPIRDVFKLWYAVMVGEAETP